MSNKLFILILGMALMLELSAAAVESNAVGQLSIEPTQIEESAPKVTSVYGISSDDYLPSVEAARKTLRPQVRRAASHPTFDLPDAFYFIGGPIFLILFLRVLIIFLNGFEEKRIEEQRIKNSQAPPEME